MSLIDYNRLSNHDISPGTHVENCLLPESITGLNVAVRSMQDGDIRSLRELFMYGNPEPTMVNIGVRNRHEILRNGHDLRDLAQLLEQTKDTEIDVYTHGEMLPANSYPAFKKYDNFIGNYGSFYATGVVGFEGPLHR